MDGSQTKNVSAYWSFTIVAALFFAVPGAALLLRVPHFTEDMARLMAPSAIRKIPFIIPSKCAASPIRMLKGLVKRERGEKDRREVLVIITPAGEAVIRELFLVHIAEVASSGPVLLESLKRVLERTP